MKKQSGFAGLELLVVVVIAAAVALVGYYVWQGHNVKTTSLPVASSSNVSSPPVTTPPAPQITTASDLSSAMQALNGTSVSSNNTDSSQLTTQSQGF